MESVKRSVAVAIRDGERVLFVQRPADDEDLPNTWGLPAASLQGEESWEDAVRRAGREKLGLELEIVREMNHGTLQRAAYGLEMKLFEAKIVSGEPNVDRFVEGVTKYQDWKWGEAEDLRPAARAGSLCSRLYLEE